MSLLSQINLVITLDEIPTYKKDSPLLSKIHNTLQVSCSSEQEATFLDNLDKKGWRWGGTSFKQCNPCDIADPPHVYSFYTTGIVVFRSHTPDDTSVPYLIDTITPDQLPHSLAELPHSCMYILFDGDDSRQQLLARLSELGWVSGSGSSLLSVFNEITADHHYVLSDSFGDNRIKFSLNTTIYHNDIPYYRMFKSNCNKLQPPIDICPACGALGEKVGFDYKCTKCWKTWF